MQGHLDFQEKEIFHGQKKKKKKKMSLILYDI